MRPLALPRILLLVGLSFGLYAAFLAASLASGVSLELERAIARTATTVMDAASGGRVVRRVTIERSGDELVYKQHVAAGNQVLEGSFRHTFHSQNLLLVAALMLATPGITWRQRGLGLGVGLALIFALDVLITTGDLWVSERKNLQLDARSGAAVPLSQVGQLLRFLHPTGGAFMAPAFVWLLAVLGPWRVAVRRALSRPEAAPAR